MKRPEGLIIPLTHVGQYGILVWVEVDMTNAEIETVLDKIVSVTEFLAREIADLVDDKANRLPNEYTAGIRRRGNEIREATSQLRTIFDTNR